MPFSTRLRFRRGILPALAALLLCGWVLTGCMEDRSNLISSEDSRSLIASFNEIEDLAANNKCFEAMDVATEVQAEIEQMSDLDSELKRSLLAGVSQLHGMVNDQEICLDEGVEAAEEEPVVEETPEGTTGETGTTQPEATTGDQGNTTDDEQDSRPPRGEGNGNQTQPEPPTTNPDPPSNPEPTPPGSGGLGPG